MSRGAMDRVQEAGLDGTSGLHPTVTSVLESAWTHRGPRPICHPSTPGKGCSLRSLGPKQGPLQVPLVGSVWSP